MYVAQRGRIVEEKRQRHLAYRESDTEFVDKITVHDGDNGRVLHEVAVPRPKGLAVRSGTLYALALTGLRWRQASSISARA